MAASRQSIEAGRGHVVLGMDDSPLRAGLASARDTINRWSNDMFAAGTRIMAVGAAIMAPFFMAIEHFATWGRELTTGIRELGIEFSDLDEILDGTRVELETLTPAVAAMSNFMMAAASGSHEAAAALETLGIAVGDLIGMTQSERLLRFADALSRISDASQRIALQRAIFGRGGLGLNIEGGAEGIRARAARADEMEGVRTPGDLRSAQAYNAAIREMKLAFGGLMITIGSAVAPSMARFVELIRDGIVRVRQFADEHREAIAAIFYFGGLLFTIGGVLSGLGSIVWFLEHSIGVLKHTVLSLGVAIFVFRMAAMAAGFGWISYSILAIQVAIKILIPMWTALTYSVYAATAAKAVWTAAVWAGTTALWAMQGALAVVTGWFGIVALAEYAWAAATATASAIATAAIWTYNAAVATAHFITWAFWVAVYVVVGLAVAAIVGLIALGSYFAIRWLLSLNAIQESMRVFMVGVRMVRDTWLAMWGGIIDYIWELWRPGLENIRYAFNAVFNAIVGWWYGTLVPAAEQIGVIISNAFSQTFRHIGELFRELVGTASAAWTGIQNAFMAGNMTLMWDIIKAGAILAWTQIRAHVEPIWNIWKDGLTDAFNVAILAIKSTFISMFAEVKAVAFEAFAEIARQSAVLAPTNAIRDAFLSHASVFDARARSARIHATAEVRDLGEAAATALENERFLRTLRDDAMRSGSDAEIAAAERALENLTRDAEMEAFLVDMERRMGTTAAGGDGLAFGTTTGVGAMMGDFGGLAALAINGRFGRTTPEERAEAQRQEQIRLLTRTVTELQEIVSLVLLRVA